VKVHAEERECYKVKEGPEFRARVIRDPPKRKASMTASGEGKKKGGRE